MIMYLLDADHTPLDVMMRDVTSSIAIPVKADIFTEKANKGENSVVPGVSPRPPPTVC